MDEVRATAVAEALGGQPWQSGGDVWLVLCQRSDGKLVVVSDEAVCLYDSHEAFDDNKSSDTIVLH